MEPEDRIVIAQAVALAGLSWPGRPRWTLPAAGTAVGVAAGAFGTVLAVLGALPHGPRLTPRVEPPSDAELLDSGPYAISRHPIYSGLIVAAGGLAVLRRRVEPLVAWVALLAVLIVKTGREERRLAGRFGAPYEAYRARTPRFLLR